MSGATGIRIVDMPDLGAFTTGSSIVGEKSGSGRFSATSLGGYFLPLSGGGAVTGTTSFSRTDAVVNNAPVLQVNYTGAGSSNGALQVNLTDTATTGFPWGITSNITLTTSGSAQPVGIASTIWRNAGNSPAFAYYAQVIDMTGVGPTSAVGMENDLFVNGPEGASTYYNANSGARVALTIGLTANLFPAWAAGTVYAQGQVIHPTGQPLYVYIAQTDGTSGVAEPTWPTSAGTVADGSVTWTFGSTYAPQISRGIAIGGGTVASGRAGQCAVGLHFHDISFYNAIIDMSHGVTMSTDVGTGALINPNVAAIRMAQDFPIDFSGTGDSPATQNQRTIKYNSTSNCFEYQALGSILFSVHDNGPVAIGGDAAPGTTGFQMQVLGNNQVGISTALGTFPTALRMASDQRLSFTNTDAAYLQYRVATGRVYYVVGGVDMWSVDGSGNVRAKGTLTGSTTP